MKKRRMVQMEKYFLVGQFLIEPFIAAKIYFYSHSQIFDLMNIFHFCRHLYELLCFCLPEKPAENLRKKTSEEQLQIQGKCSAYDKTSVIP